MLEFDEAHAPGQAKIKVIGVGGGGGNAVNTMIEAGLEGVEFIVANTDCQVLDTSQAPVRVQLGKALTKGLGAGANPEIGRAAALEDAARVAEVINGSDMVFVTAGMGGGTGTGAAPVIAQVARDLGALTVGVVTRPFLFEGLQRRKKAGNGIAELAKAVDALIVIPNDRLVALAGDNMLFKDAFGMVDSVLLNAVRGISDLVTVPGLVNVDFADVRAVMTGMGRALMGTGRGSGKNGAVDAAQGAINSPLLEDVSIDGATGVLINITGGPNLTLNEITAACSLIQEAADPDANIIFGSVIDANAGDEFRITVIATGFQGNLVSDLDSNRRGVGAKRTADQMALPMKSEAASAPSSVAVPVTAPYPVATSPQLVSGPNLAAFEAAPVDLDQTPVPMPLGGYAPAPAQAAASAPTAPAAAARAAVLPVVGAAGSGPYAAPVSGPYPTPGASPLGMAPSGPQAVPAYAASGGVSGAMARRNSGPLPMLGPDDLGVEESEYDRPAYLRRGLITPETVER